MHAPASPSGEPERIEFVSLRSDWYGGDAMAKLVRRARPDGARPVLLANFPRQWLPLFSWAGARWEGSCEPPAYVPFVSDRSERELVAEIERARSKGQLRLLVELIAGADPLVAEILPRVDAFAGDGPDRSDDGRMLLSNWHAYGRSEIRGFEQELGSFRQSHPDVIFLPCGRARPYNLSPTHRRINGALREAGVDIARHDLIVITSLGPVPMAMWEHPVVLRYDTGVRDIYRMLVLFRRMLRQARYAVAWDCLRLRPYKDLIAILQNEGYVRDVRQFGVGRSKSVPAYRR